MAKQKRRKAVPKFVAYFRKARAEMTNTHDTSEEAYRQARDALAGKTWPPK